MRNKNKIKHNTFSFYFLNPSEKINLIRLCLFMCAYVYVCNYISKQQKVYYYYLKHI